MNNKRIFIFLIFLFFVKLALAAFVPVFGDEAYYYIWSLHPQLSYYDHPGMVSWMIYIGHLIFPAGHAFSLRFTFVLVSFFTSLVWLPLLKRFGFSEKQQFIFFVFLFLNPLFGIGSVAATPDVPLVFFWSLSFLFFNRILESKSVSNYAALGVALGLGFCSKYHIVLFVLSGLIYLILSKKIKSLSLAGIATTIFFGAFSSIPVLMWNYNNDWISFRFQLNHGLGENEFSWAWPISFVLAQALIINPFFIAPLFKKSLESFSLNGVFSLSQIGFFFVSSFRNVVEGNWPLTSHLHTISRALKVLDSKSIRNAFIFWIFFYCILGAFFLSDYSKKVRKNLVNSSQFDQIYEILKTHQPLYGPSYQVSSLLSWKTQSMVPKLRELSRHDFFDSLPESMPSEKQFYVLKNDYSGWPAQFEKYKKIKLQSFDNIGLELYQFNYE